MNENVIELYKIVIESHVTGEAKKSVHVVCTFYTQSFRLFSLYIDLFMLLEIFKNFCTQNEIRRYLVLKRKKMKMSAKNVNMKSILYLETR